jgi:hypothetical protein
MTSQDPTDPPRGSTPRRGLWAIGAFVVVVLIIAAIAYRNPSPTSSTASGPSATQSPPSSTGQGGAANTGAAR